MIIKTCKIANGRSSDHTAPPCISLKSAALRLVLVLAIAPASAFHMGGRPEHNSVGRSFSTTFYRRESAFPRKENRSGMAARSSHKTVSTRLRYRDGDEDLIGSRTKGEAAAIANVSHPRWWPTWFPVKEAVADSQGASSTGTGSQEVVDDYLEFLDRRYHRLHDDEEAPREPKFSAWNWLKQGPEAGRTFTQPEEENALYVLGVAGLASERLLQKHQPGARSASESTSESVATTTVDVEVIPTSKLAVLLALVLRKVSPVTTVLALSRQALVRYETRKARQLGAFLASSLFVAPARVGRALLNLSGGKRNLACTITIATTLTVFLVRSLIRVALSEGASVSATTGV